jgi:hypothetical protein
LILKAFPHYKNEEREREKTVEAHEMYRVQISGLPAAVVAIWGHVAAQGPKFTGGPRSCYFITYFKSVLTVIS